MKPINVFFRICFPFIALIIIAFLFISSLAHQTLKDNLKLKPSPTPINHSSWVKFNDKSDKITFEYPTDWVKGTNDSEVSIISSITSADKSQFMLIEKTSYKNINEYTSYLNTKIFSSIANKSIPNGTNIKNVTINNRHYLLSTHTEDTTISLMYAFEKNNNVFVIHFNAQGNLALLQSSVDEIMPTFNY